MARAASGRSTIFRREPRTSRSLGGIPPNPPGQIPRNPKRKRGRIRIVTRPRLRFGLQNSEKTLRVRLQRLQARKTRKRGCALLARRACVRVATKPSPQGCRSFVVVLFCLLASLPISAAQPPSATERMGPDGILGSLVICGGGTLPAEIRAKFVELAGGKEAQLVVIPTANGRAERENTGRVDVWIDDGIKSVTVLHTRDRNTANRDGFVAPLQIATAVWFEGGAQSRIADAYLGTAVERELYALLQRGGVVGGTSAGAAIMSRTMIARNNSVPDVQTGFQLLPGTIIDQHFLKRNRQPRLRQALHDHPGLLGIGIDESTAIVVQKSRARVIGTNQVHFYDHDSDRIDRDGRDYISISAPREFDLVRCEIVD